MKSLFASLAVSVITGLLAIPQPSVAKTPDGKTPAEETVCDVLRDATPGLYGLCVAYCEAHDAELLAPDGDPEKLDTPNRRILENYNKKKKKSDPPMPCVLQEPGGCPCWTAEQLTFALPPTTDPDANLPNACQASPVTIENFEAGDDEPGFQLRVIAFEQCEVINQKNYPGLPPSGEADLMGEESQVCTELLVSHAQNQGTPGLVWDCF